MTVQELVEKMILSHPLLAHDVKVLQGRIDATGAFLRFVRVAGQPIVVLDAEQVRRRWADGRFAIGLPAHAAGDHLGTGILGDPTAQVVALSPHSEWVSFVPRGSMPTITVTAGHVIEDLSPPALRLVAGGLGGLAVLQWTALADRR